MSENFVDWQIQGPDWVSVNHPGLLDYLNTKMPWFEWELFQVPGEGPKSAYQWVLVGRRYKGYVAYRVPSKLGHIQRRDLERMPRETPIDYMFPPPGVVRFPLPSRLN
jgi:hypothetical protein